MTIDDLKQFGARYVAAWSSHNAASVALFFAENGSLKINDAADYQRQLHEGTRT